MELQTSHTFKLLKKSFIKKFVFKNLHEECQGSKMKIFSYRRSINFFNFCNKPRSRLATIFEI